MFIIIFWNLRKRIKFTTTTTTKNYNNNIETLKLQVISFDSSV